MVLLIDNYDSFTYNLYQYFSVFVDIVVVKNDDSNLLTEDLTKYEALILSPGPGKPSDAGFMPKVIEKYYDKMPIFGICLGHQALIEFFGGKIVLAPEVKHGKISMVKHSENNLFLNFSNPIEVMRYHSLVAEKAHFPKTLQIEAESLEDETIQAFKHINLPIFGVQFHPESIGTEKGKEIIQNFLRNI